MEYQTVVEIAAPPARVFDVLADVTNWSRWTASVSSSTVLTGVPLDIGSQVKVHQPRMPANTWTITAWEPGSRFTWATARGGYRMVADHLVEATPEGSRLTLSLTTSGPTASIVDRFAGSMARRYVDTEAAGLKSASEQAG
jgi:uncharacterized protein YndB with AHSA1/START domain